MSTSFQDGGKLGIEIRMEQDAHYCTLVMKCLRKIQSGFWPQEYIDSIFQKFGRFPIDIYDAAFFIEIHTGIQSGQILTKEIDLGQEPDMDKRIEENKKKLSFLSSPFYFTIRCGNYDDDGTLGWKSPIKCGQTCDTKKTELIQPRFVPLEIGDTQAFTTFAHLGREGFSGLACQDQF